MCGGNLQCQPSNPLWCVPVLSLSLLSCQQSCVTQVATRPGRISAQEDFLPTQLEHQHIAQFKGRGSAFVFIHDWIKKKLCSETIWIILDYYFHDPQLVILVAPYRPFALFSSSTPLTPIPWVTCSSTMKHLGKTKSHKTSTNSPPR